MNSKIKIALILFAIAFVLRVSEEPVWSRIREIPMGSPAQFPLLLAFGSLLFVIPALLLAGVVLFIMGAGDKSK